MKAELMLGSIQKEHVFMKRDCAMQSRSFNRFAMYYRLE